jgi:hypothetical protein
LLAKGGTSKKRQSPDLHKVLTQSNKVNPWTLQTALIVCNNERRVFCFYVLFLFVSANNSWICEVWLVFSIECELVYKDLEDFLWNKNLKDVQ